MTYIVQAAGALLIGAAVWLRAERWMTINHATFWGMTGILLATAGGLPPLSGWLNGLGAGGGMLFCVIGAVALVGGMIASLCLSRLSVKKQELAMRRSLLSLQDRKILERLGKVKEETPCCNQHTGTDGGGPSGAA